MPSSATTRLRLEKQATGENSNTWGANLNTKALDLIDAAIAGRTAFALSGSKTLTSTNYAADEARAIFLDVTSGTGGTITIPGVEKTYIVRNNSSGSVVITTGSGTSATIATGLVQWVVSDATNVYVDSSVSAAAASAAAAAASASAADTDATAAAASASAAATSETNAATSEDNAAASAAEAAGYAASMGGGWTLIETIATTSGTQIDFDNLPSTYQDLLFVFNGVSGSAAANLQFAVSANSSAYGSGAAVVNSSGFTGSNGINGAIFVPYYNGSIGAALPALSGTSLGSSASTLADETNTSPIVWKCAGIDAVRFTVSSGTFDLGSISLYAK